MQIISYILLFFNEKYLKDCCRPPGGGTPEGGAMGTLHLTI